ncbi:DUF992 domain-containing protein [Aureimonas populi]|uniref:DUF992 domain-containing protein n=1 Tax=Aureimonas populi TaxID=1701758 RepID=A0ABW5CK02_9HYPH|nr:DUF992 domain-containing protein [Aureimonas populi]
MSLPRLARSLAAGSVLLAAVSAAPAANAQSGVTLGSLTCLSEGSTGYIIGSSENVACTFEAVGGGASETYVGTLEKFGLDIGVTGETVMEWTVLAASSDVYAPGALAGRYVGASASASFAIGAGANLLVGGSSEGFTLQPVSLQAQEGVNAALGVTEFTLASAIPVEPAAEVIVVQ